MPCSFDEENDEEYEDFEDMTTEANIADEGIQFAITKDALGRIADAAVARIAASLHYTVEKAVKERVEAMLDDAWKASVGTIIGQAFDEFISEPPAKELSDGRAEAPEWAKGIMGRWHNIPEGQTPVNQAVRLMVKQYMEEQVNKDGVKCSDSYYKVGTRIEWMLKKQIEAQLKTDLDKAVADVRGRATALVTRQLGAFVAANLMPPIEVPALPAR